MTYRQPVQALTSCRRRGGLDVPAWAEPSRDRSIMAPDNEASTRRGGVTFKFAKQTRSPAASRWRRWTQDAPFYPYTATTMYNAPGPEPASRSTLQRQSYGGKINTTMYNFAFSTRPVEGLTLRAQYRVRPEGQLGQVRHHGRRVYRQRSVGRRDGHRCRPIRPRDGERLRHQDSRFTASATYDFKALTLEGQVRSGQLERTHREAEKGTESGMGLTALYHYNDWLGFRGTYDLSKRTAEGETIYGYQMDEAVYEKRRTGVDIELTPVAGLDLQRRLLPPQRDTWTVRTASSCQRRTEARCGATPNTPSGLLDTKYDSYTGEFNYVRARGSRWAGTTRTRRTRRTNQWSTTTAATP